MTDASPSLRWRIAAGALSLLMLLAAEEKARPVQAAAEPSHAQAVSDALTPESDEPQPPAPLVVRATLPDGLAPRALDRGGSPVAAGARLLRSACVNDGPSSPGVFGAFAIVSQPAEFVRTSAFCRPLPFNSLDCATSALRRLHGSLWRIGPPVA